MRAPTLLVAAAGLGLALAGCASEQPREWMKLNEKYTTADFERDRAACTRGGRLDEDCMRGRGWVSVTASKEYKAPEMRGGPLPLPGQPTGRY